MGSSARGLPASARAMTRAVGQFARNPRAAWVLPGFNRGVEYARRIAAPSTGAATDRESPEAAEAAEAAGSVNPLWDRFASRSKGPGIYKWEHYFEIYHRHFQKFVGTDVDIMEIGIFSGGSLGLWPDYLGDGCHVYGVDISPSCKAYEREGVTVLIGDQEDRSFWARVRSDLDGLDILIDDGGHTPEQQMVTLEEMLAFVRPGGVYVCEDVHHAANGFTAFAAGLVSQLNEFRGGESGVDPTAFQRTVHSIHFYPYTMVIEKHLVPPTELHSIARGTEWNPAPYGWVERGPE